VVSRFVEPSNVVGGASTRVLLRALLNVVALLAVEGGGGGGDEGDIGDIWDELSSLLIFGPGVN